MNNGIFMRPAKDGGFIVSSSDIMSIYGDGMPRLAQPEPLFAGTLTGCLAYLETVFSPPSAVTPASDDWINWHGGPKGISDQFLVEVTFRNGDTIIKMSEDLDWQHADAEHDIVKYRLLRFVRP